MGAFEFIYSNGQMSGKGDASLFTSELSCNGKEYSISLSFHQAAGVFYSGNLRNLLRSFSYGGHVFDTCTPEDKYDLVNANTRIIINGHKAKDAAVTLVRGNGHEDYIFEIKNIPIYKKEEITDIYISVGNTDELEECVTEKSQQYTDFYRSAD